MSEADDRVTDAVVSLARYNIPPDIQELLISGDAMRGIPPGALSAALPPKLGTPKSVKETDRFYGDPVVRFRAMAESTYPLESIDGSHFRMWCAIAANEIETLRKRLRRKDSSHD